MCTCCRGSVVRAGLLTSAIACILTTPLLWYLVSSLSSAAFASSLLKRQDSLKRACNQNSVDERRADSFEQKQWGYVKLKYASVVTCVLFCCCSNALQGWTRYVRCLRRFCSQRTPVHPVSKLSLEIWQHHNYCGRWERVRRIQARPL